MTDGNTFYCDIIANKHMLPNALLQYSHINQILDMKNTTNKRPHRPHGSSEQQFRQNTMVLWQIYLFKKFP